MQKSKIGLVMFNGKFEDGGLPTPPLIIHSTSTTKPAPPLLPPLTSKGTIPLSSLLSSRSRSLLAHLNSFKAGKKKVSLQHQENGKLILKDGSRKKKQPDSLQSRIMECKNPQEIETLLIQEGIVPST